jgi:hypothetical protein
MRLIESLQQYPEEWWGYSEVHGWVVLDWGVPGNRTDRTRTFIRCRDWKTITIPFSEWGRPLFVWANAYINSIEDETRRAAELGVLNVLRARARPFLDEAARVRRADAERIRQETASKAAAEPERAKPDTEQPLLKAAKRDCYSSRLPPGRLHRITHCWNCSSGLDNSVNPECPACGWIQCECGACGCGYSAHR